MCAIYLKINEDLCLSLDKFKLKKLISVQSIGLSGLHTQVLAHAMIVAHHLLIRPQVELLVILRELPVADGAVLVHDAADLHDVAGLHALGVALELDDLYGGVCKKGKRGITNSLAFFYLPSFVFMYSTFSSTLSILPTNAMVFPVKAGI